MLKILGIISAAVLLFSVISYWTTPVYEVADPADDRTLYAESLPKKNGQVLCLNNETGEFEWIDVVMISDQLKDRLYWIVKNDSVYMASGDGWKKLYSISDRL